MVCWEKAMFWRKKFAFLISGRDSLRERTIRHADENHPALLGLSNVFNIVTLSSLWLVGDMADAKLFAENEHCPTWEGLGQSRGVLYIHVQYSVLRPVPPYWSPVWSWHVCTYRIHQISVARGVRLILPDGLMIGQSTPVLYLPVQYIPTVL